jgi:hypothetical protein
MSGSFPARRFGSRRDDLNSQWWHLADQGLNRCVARHAMGKATVELAVNGKDAVMPTIIRKKSKPYEWVVGSVPLNDVAIVEKKLPRDFITEVGFGITQKCHEYLHPLIEGED